MVKTKFLNVTYEFLPTPLVFLFVYFEAILEAIAKRTYSFISVILGNLSYNILGDCLRNIWIFKLDCAEIGTYLEQFDRGLEHFRR